MGELSDVTHASGDKQNLTRHIRLFSGKYTSNREEGYRNKY